jgi:hypothetical protein
MGEIEGYGWGGSLFLVRQRLLSVPRSDVREVTREGEGMSEMKKIGEERNGAYEIYRLELEILFKLGCNGRG